MATTEGRESRGCCVFSYLPQLLLRALPMQLWIAFLLVGDANWTRWPPWC